jgi:UDP-glucose 4-epimerase
MHPESSRACASRRVLVTGAGGFLGGYIVDELLASGWSVIGLVRSPHPFLPLTHPRFHLITGDLVQFAQDTIPLPECEAICHCAAAMPDRQSDGSELERLMRTNVLVTDYLVRHALSGPRRFVYLSAANMYTRADTPAGEDSPVYPADHAPVYLGSKLLGELIVEHARRARGLAALSLRVTTPYGVRRTPRDVVSRFVQDAMTGKPLVVMQQGAALHDWVHAGDVAHIVAQSLDAGDPGIYNVGCGQSRSVLDLARLVAAQFPPGEVQIEVQPRTGTTPLGFQPVSIAKAVATWGYQPRQLEDGLRDVTRRSEQKCA